MACSGRYWGARGRCQRQGTLLSLKRHLSSHTVVSPQIYLKGHKHCQLANPRKSGRRSQFYLQGRSHTQLCVGRAPLQGALGKPTTDYSRSTHPPLQKQKFNGFSAVSGTGQHGPRGTAGGCPRLRDRMPSVLALSLARLQHLLLYWIEGVGQFPQSHRSSLDPTGQPERHTSKAGSGYTSTRTHCHCTDENKGSICQSRCSLGRLIWAVFGSKMQPRSWGQHSRAQHDLAPRK